MRIVFLGTWVFTICTTIFNGSLGVLRLMHDQWILATVHLICFIINIATLIVMVRVTKPIWAKYK